MMAWNRCSESGDCALAGEMRELAPPNHLLIGNLDQPAFQGHEVEKDLAELYFGAKRVGLVYHFRCAARSRPLYTPAGRLVTIGLKAIYFEFFSRPLGRLSGIRRIAALK